jgi:hypothetical protein
MPEKIYIGNFSKGLTQNRLPFVIDNDSFPVLVNAYSWRGRVKRKRGTSLIGRLQVQAPSMSLGLSLANPWTFTLPFPALPIAPGSVTITIATLPSPIVFIDNGEGVLTSATPGNSGTINYLTGSVTLTTSTVPGVSAAATLSYNPNLPVMGLKDFVQNTIPSAAGFNAQYPLLLAFDTKRAYQINTVNNFYNVSFYKSTNVPVIWSGTDYQQFWTVNYENALWATNGKPGFYFMGGITNIVPTGSATLTLNITLPGNGLVLGDYIFLYEITETFNNLQTSLNGVSGKVTTPGNPTFTITVSSNLNPPVAATYRTYVSGGIIQYLTGTQSGSGDGIRWYDGDPTGGSGLPNTPGLGWVNFAPPLTQSGTVFGFDNLTPKQYYLVGATAILPFKDRLLFFGPYIQSVTDVNATQLIDTVIWSWNGTPYYSAPTPVANGTASLGFDPTAYWVNVTGKGGYLSAGIQQSIVTATRNEDVILVGFTNKQTRFIYTGNDLFPFLFYAINSEFGSSSTFSGVTLDKGALTIGSYGIFLTTQESSQRIDLSIPDLVFNITKTGVSKVTGQPNFASQRVNSSRDFFKEWVYFSYPHSASPWDYPTQTFLYNYRDDTWAILYENYTAHGLFRRISGLTWATLNKTYPTWDSWNDPWNSSVTTGMFPSVCAGNQQGFVMQLGQGTAEAQSQYISAITATPDNLVLQITSPNHCLMEGDYIYLQNITGSTTLNGLIGQVSLIFLSPDVYDPNNFLLTFLSPPVFSGTYTGGGTYARLAQPFIQTKQFPIYWEEGRQVRLGVQKYLFDKTSLGAVEIQIYLSQDPSDPWNGGMIVPVSGSTNNSLIYNDVISTAPELGSLTSPNPPAANQFQIWHRMNTSLIGDTFQIGVTLNDSQMRNIVQATSEVSLQGIILEVFPGPQLG